MTDRLDVCCLNYPPSDAPCSLTRSKRFESIAASFHHFNTLQDYEAYLDQATETRIILTVPSAFAKGIVEKYHDRSDVLAICLLNTEPEEQGELDKDLLGVSIRPLPKRFSRFLFIFRNDSQKYELPSPVLWITGGLVNVFTSRSPSTCSKRRKLGKHRETLMVVFFIFAV